MRILVGAMVLAAAPLGAQSAAEVGVWRITFPVKVQMQNDVVTPVMGGATLTISASGDSLLGNLVVDSIPGEALRPPQVLGGKSTGKEVVLTGRSQATLNMNGNLREATSVSTWTLRTVGDSISGTVNRSIEGMAMPPMPPQQVSGLRKKG